MLKNDKIAMLLVRLLVLRGNGWKSRTEGQMLVVSESTLWGWNRKVKAVWFGVIRVFIYHLFLSLRLRIQVSHQTFSSWC